MERERSWCRVRVVDDDGAVTVEVTLRGADAPDLGAVDAIARLALRARRAGWAVTLEGAVEELRELLVLAALPVEVRGEAEAREEPVGIERGEEEAQLGDAP